MMSSSVSDLKLGLAPQREPRGSRPMSRFILWSIDSVRPGLGGSR